MEKIKCVIVDDEFRVLKTLEEFVQQIPQLDLVATFTDPIKALDFISNSDVYLAFLDISMNGLSGLDLATRIPDKKVVFITGHEEFALYSWKLQNVVGYILKPIFFDDILNVIKRITAFFNVDLISPRINSDLFLVYKKDNAIVKIDYDSIIYFEAKGHYSTIYFEGRETIAPVPLWEFEKSLPKSKFLRVNKSCIANMNKIIEEDAKEILLMGGFKLKPGKAYKGKIIATN